MKLCLTFLFAAGLLATSARAEIVDFDHTAPGTLPAGWQGGVTGKGEPKWSVETDDSAPSKPAVLKQSGFGKYCWCVNKNVSLKDGHIEVKFKPLSGVEDASGGLIWRWQDGNNYYIARANALEDNVTIYHTIKGTRKECGRATAKVASNQWHTLRVDFHGNHFVVTFDGAKALEWDDDTFKTAGAAGVWTKADSVTVFDDFVFEGK